MDLSEENKSQGSMVIGKIAYGAVFVVVLPLVLILWATLTAESVRLRPVESPWLGALLSVAGSALMLTGIGAIYVYGHGLPMNAYPPARFVVESVYRYLAHPIYVGFSVLCFGVAILAGSASGFWLIAPIAALGCVALVEGYEREATLEHFKGARAMPFLRLASDSDRPPAIAERISTLVFTAVPAVLFTLLANRLADDLGQISLYAHERVSSQVLSWAWLTELMWLVFVAIVPFLASSSRQLRNFVIASSVSLVLAGLVFLAIPYLEPSGFLGRTPAVHGLAVALTLLSASTLGARGRGWKIVFHGLALLTMAAGVLTGAYTPRELLIGVGIYAAATNTAAIWRLIRRVTEWVANSWSEWTLGPVRVINHGFFAAAGSFVALSIIGVLVGPDHVPFVLLITFLAITISALSAQWIEGSPRLLRPFGWYGGVVGAFLGALISYLLGAETWLLVAAFCVGSPFVQAAGRLRCLVQGCCHGRTTTDSLGIRFNHPLSRVCRIADLKDKPLHATQLYSIACNFVVAAIVLRMWFSGASFSLIFGAYFILTGMGRFVEESYRGEPQTPRYGGLRLYQIFAILSVAVGIGATMITGVGNAGPPIFSWDAIVASGVFALFVCFAFGIDFPGSERRFARLT
jgi:protein-S-isoprenylcysteine O-methyltransferase Ste14